MPGRLFFHPSTVLSLLFYNIWSKNIAFCFVKVMPKVFVDTVPYVELLMQLHTGAEHFGNVSFRYSELPSLYHIEALIDVNHPRQDCDITCLL